MDDRALVLRIRAGDVDAFETLVHLHSGALLRIAAAITGSRDSAKDVVQEVFMRLWIQGAALTIHGDVRGYLWRAVRNQAVQILRYEHVRYRAHDRMQSEYVETPRSAVNAATHTLDEEVLHGEVHTILAELPARCRQIFLMHWRDELSAEEIAWALGIGLRTVQNQIARAVRRLAQQLDPARDA